MLTALACGSSGPAIEVVATPVVVPQATAALPVDSLEDGPTATPVVVSPVPTVTLLEGVADVYVSPNPSGLTLHYADPQTNRELATVPIAARAVQITGAGVIFAGSGGLPTRAAANGEHSVYSVATPAEGISFYEYLPGADGAFIVWQEATSVQDGTRSIVYLGRVGSNTAIPILDEDLEPGESIHLVSLSSDSETLFYDRREASSGVSAFPPVADLWALDIGNNDTRHLPGEPACGNAFCNATFSPDGRYLARALPASLDGGAMVLYDLQADKDEEEVARFTLPVSGEDDNYEAGFASLSPDGSRLVYVLAEGPPQEQVFSYVLAEVGDGTQERLATSNNTLLRPVRWQDALTLVLTAEPGVYDMWTLNIITGELRRISDRLYMGQVTLP